MLENQVNEDKKKKNENIKYVQIKLQQINTKKGI